MISASRPCRSSASASVRDVADRLGHLLLAEADHAVVHPHPGERPSAAGLGLGDLVLVVREHEVEARRRGCRSRARAGFSAIAEHSMCHPGRPRPHGESHAGVLVGLVRLPQREVERVALERLLLVGLALVPRLEILEPAVGELAVLVEAAHAEVHVASARIGVAALDQALDQVDDLADRLARERLAVGAPQREPVGVGAVVRRSSRARARSDGTPRARAAT